MVEQTPKLPIEELPLASQLVRAHLGEIDLTDGQVGAGSVVVRAANHIPGAIDRIDRVAVTQPSVAREGLDYRGVVTWQHADGATTAAGGVEKIDKIVHHIPSDRPGDVA